MIAEQTPVNGFGGERATQLVRPIDRRDVVVAGQHHHREISQPFIRSDFRKQREPVNLRHFNIENKYVVGRLSEPIRASAPSQAVSIVADGAEIDACEFPQNWVVVDDEDTERLIQNECPRRRPIVWNAHDVKPFAILL